MAYLNLLYVKSMRTAFPQKGTTRAHLYAIREWPCLATPQSTNDAHDEYLYGLSVGPIDTQNGEDHTINNANTLTISDDDLFASFVDAENFEFEYGRQLELAPEGEEWSMF